MATRRKSKQKASADDRSDMVQRKLTDPQAKTKSKELANLTRVHNALKEKKAAQNKKWNETLREHEDQIAILAEEVDSGMCWVDAQMKLAE